MQVRVLGSAAGGGAPQWNCACPNCTLLRAGDAAQWRTQDCLAVGDGKGNWFLLNASPDLRVQILATEELRPGPGRRQSPVRGVLLTDAELDHTLGLFSLREDPGLDVYAAPPVLRTLRQDLPAQRVLEAYGDRWSWHETLPDIPFPLGSRLSATAIAVGSKPPRYAVSSAAGDGPWVTAYRIKDRQTGGVLVYAPVLPDWPPELDKACQDAQYLIIDGTFFREDDLLAADSTTPARSMGHLPVTGSDGSLVHLPDLPGPQVLYTHLNNTNPLLHQASSACRAVRGTGAWIADDGMVLDL